MSHRNDPQPESLESRLRAFLHREADELVRAAEQIDKIVTLDPRMAKDMRVREYSATIHGRLAEFAAVRALLEAWEIDAAGGFSPEGVIGSGAEPGDDSRAT